MVIDLTYDDVIQLLSSIRTSLIENHRIISTSTAEHADFVERSNALLTEVKHKLELLQLEILKDELNREDA